MKNMFSQKTAPRAQKRLRIIPNKSARTLFKHYCCPTITVALKRNRHRKISYRYNGITYIWAFVPTIRAKQQAYTLKWMIFFLFSFCLLCFAYSFFFFRCRFCCYLSIVFFFLSFVRTFVGFIRSFVRSWIGMRKCVYAWILLFIDWIFQVVKEKQCAPRYTLIHLSNTCCARCWSTIEWMFYGIVEKMFARLYM